MGFQELLAAALLNYGVVHPQLGHNAEGERQGVPVSVDYKTMTEHWNTPDRNKAAAINAAGFKASDDIGRALEGSDVEDEWRTTTAIQKAIYPLIVKKMTGGRASEGGDMGELERLSGNKNVRNTYYLSALADLLKAKNPKQTWDVGVEVMPGSTAVGPVFRKRF